MAVSAAAALLDELMGRNRNVNPDDSDNKLTWESPDMCRHYLVKFCPHDLFTNTKSDLGLCDKVHDEDIKREFDASNTHRRAAFEDDFIRYADTMLLDVDKRIRKGRQRLSLSVKEALSNSTTGDAVVDEQIELLSERITGLVSEAERLGNEGNVEDAQGLSKLCDKLREERDQLRKAHENTVWHQAPILIQAAEMAASQEKQMEVCEICGAFLIVGDAQQRIDDHLTGKQHMGFAKLRDAIQEIKDSREKLREDREKQREKEREERRRLLDEEDMRRMPVDRNRGDRPPRDDRRDRPDRRDMERRAERPPRPDREMDRRDRHDRGDRRRNSRDRERRSRDRDAGRQRRGRHDDYHGARNGGDR